MLAVDDPRGARAPKGIEGKVPDFTQDPGQADPSLGLPGRPALIPVLPPTTSLHPHR